MPAGVLVNALSIVAGGIFGSIVSVISGAHSILLAKSILDLFTSMILPAPWVWPFLPLQPLSW